MKNLQSLIERTLSKSVEIEKGYHFGPTLKRLRLEKRKNQFEIYNAVKKPQSYVSKIENASRNPDLKVLEAYSKILNMDLSELLKAIMDDYILHLKGQMKLVDNLILEIDEKFSEVHDLKPDTRPQNKLKSRVRCKNKGTRTRNSAIKSYKGSRATFLRKSKLSSPRPTRNIN